MLLGVVADDFTGASDIANTLARAGMATTQFVGVPEAGSSIDCDAGVIALKTRSVPVGEAVSASLAALAWLSQQGCRQYVFKYCSTFDSTPAGNIGPVAEAMLDALNAPMAIVCPAFPATDRRVFMGHLFVGDRLLNESGMERHPLNPMTDPDIRRWLRRQTSSDVGFVDASTVRLGVGATVAALSQQAAAGSRLVVVDATDESDLRTVGAAVADHRLVTGASGIATGLADNLRAANATFAAQQPPVPVDGPGLVLCGSCSTTSQRQVRVFLEEHAGLRLYPEQLAAGEITVAETLRWVHSCQTTPIVYSSTDVSVSRSVDPATARRIESFFAVLAAGAVEGGVRRLVVGGGETSGAVVSALGVRRFTIGQEIDPGVPTLLADLGGPFGLVLKSGNFGSSDFFARALERLEHP